MARPVGNNLCITPEVGSGINQDDYFRTKS